ncbi:MAG TPA: helix-turn-helix transcriptional regulator [Kofleriaceae bacterium]|jgi:hypothetical protein|nr:helix-turn-helix transcriptional regulator [Kofleriaceae bacterium]
MARRALGDHDVTRRLAAAKDALADAWSHPEGLAVAARAVSEVVPGTCGVIYFRERDGSFGEIGHDTTGRLETQWERWPMHDTLARLQPYVSYQLRGPDRYAGRFVAMEEHYEDRHEAREGYIREAIKPNGFAEHVRLILHRRGRMRLWCGVFRPLEDPPLGREEIVRLQHLVPAIRDTVRGADLTRYGRAAPGVVQALLEVLDQPAWLITGRGTIVHANSTARVLGRDVSTAARRAAATERDRRFAVSRVSIGGEHFALTIGRSVIATTTLPASLARVASLLVRGLSDKEIAAELDAPLDTVRTYVRRIYARLGVRNRVQLATVWRAP